jgi:hypothetical protein
MANLYFPFVEHQQVKVYKKISLTSSTILDNLNNSLLDGRERKPGNTHSEFAEILLNQSQDELCERSRVGIRILSKHQRVN